MDEISLRLFEERGKRCKEGEKELLCMAAHVFKCKGCSNTRLHGKDCSKSKCDRLTPSKKKKKSSTDRSSKFHKDGAKVAKLGERSETAEVTIIQDEGEKDGRPETRGVPSERAEAILQVGGGSSTETSKHHGLRLPLKDQRENEPLEKEDIQDGQDEALVARFFEGTIPIGEERRRDALKKMQVKARKAKEKKEQQKREIEASPH